MNGWEFHSRSLQSRKISGFRFKKNVRLSQEECFLESKQKKNTLFHYLYENNCHTIDFVKIWSLIAILLKCNSLKLYFLPQEYFCMNNLTSLEENLELYYSGYTTTLVSAFPQDNINKLVDLLAVCQRIFDSLFVNSFLLKSLFCFYLAQQLV